MTTTLPPTVDAGELPPLPEPFKIASTIKCASCGSPYEPVKRSMAVGGMFGIGMAPNSHACKCGCTTIMGTLGEGEMPIKYTADQMRAYALQAIAAAKPQMPQSVVLAVECLEGHGNVHIRMLLGWLRAQGLLPDEGTSP